MDNLYILLVPGAINAGLDRSLFWINLILFLCVAFPVNRYLMDRGKGLAVAHAYHDNS